MPIKIKSTQFKQNISNLRRRISSHRMAAKLTISPGNDWWYYQEFGTATHNESEDAQTLYGRVNTAISSLGGESGGGYVIEPVQAKMLSWPGPDGQRVFRAAVIHPGVEPTAMIRRVLKDIHEHVGESIGQSLAATGYNSNHLRDVLEAAMQYAKELIVQSVGASLPGTRADGKLNGQLAADVFERETQIEILD